MEGEKVGREWMVSCRPSIPVDNVKLCIEILFSPTSQLLMSYVIYLVMMFCGPVQQGCREV